MHEFYELKEMLMDEVKELTKKGELTAGSLDTVDKLLNSIKNTCKIIMYDEYDSEGQYSRQSMQGAGMSSERSYAGARRDSRGRYSRTGGMSYGRGGRYSRENSYGGDSQEKVEILREMMDEASTEEERTVLKRLIRRVESE